MKIGIDISQTAYEGTGVANYLQNFVQNLLKTDKKNEYILFFSSLRRPIPEFVKSLLNSRIKLKTRRMPPTMLNVFWNKLHIMPIEDLIGPIDIFISSDWTQPPSRKAKLATILYDLIIYRYPEEMDLKIVYAQRDRLRWVKKECDLTFCISESTKQDAKDILGIEDSKLKVIYPGI